MGAAVRLHTHSIVPSEANVREWGRIGSSGTVRADWFGTEEEARAANETMILRKSRRGYRHTAA